MKLAFIGAFLLAVVPSTSMSLPDFDKLWDYSNPLATEEKFRALLPEAQKSNNREYQAELLTQLARTYGLQGQFEQAHLTLDRADGLIDDATMPKARVRYLLERGRVLNSSEKPAEAKPLFEQAMELASTNQLEQYAIDAVHMIAIVDPTTDGQLKWNYRGVELAEASKDPAARRWLASLYNNIGCTLDDAKRYDEAMTAFQKALELRKTMNQPRELLIAEYTIARTLRHQNKVDEALAMALAIHERAKSAGQVDPYVCEEIGEDLLLKGKSTEAALYFRIAFEELSKDTWLKRNEPARLERLKQLSGEEHGH
jgi:tetratricopeptide (TPR) repeat protein